MATTAIVRPYSVRISYGTQNDAFTACAVLETALGPLRICGSISKRLAAVAYQKWLAMLAKQGVNPGDLRTFAARVVRYLLDRGLLTEMRKLGSDPVSAAQKGLLVAQKTGDPRTDLFIAKNLPIIEAVRRGETTAVAKVTKLRALAERGEPRAKMAYEALRRALVNHEPIAAAGYAIGAVPVRVLHTPGTPVKVSAMPGMITSVRGAYASPVLLAAARRAPTRMISARMATTIDQLRAERVRRTGR